MAANEYYGGGFNHHDRPPQPSSLNKPTGLNAPSPHPAYGGPYDPRNSQYTLGSEQDYSSTVAGTRPHDADQYADDIPLKANASHNGRPDYADYDTHYPPSPESQRNPLDDPANYPARKGGRFFKKKNAWAVYVITAVQIAVFIAEIARNAQLTGSPIMIHPSVNPMIGPSPYVQINMGARFVACMRNVKGIQDSPVEIQWPCPNTTTSDNNSPSNQCQLSDLCGFKPVPNPKAGGTIDDKPEPNQWFRFIIPIFLHAGLVHIGFNMLVQLTIGADMEKKIGWWRFIIVYFASGIFGFVLGGNFAAPGIASTGASGSLFGIFALTVLDLLYSWKSRKSPKSELVTLLVTIALSFLLGLLPGLDNFSHIGGFLTGLVLGICLLRSPDTLRERIGLKSPYAPMSGGAGLDSGDPKAFIKQPVGFFKGRKPLWWAWWLLRAGALIGIIVAFIVLLNNFYKYRTTCSWCKYLTCLPIKNWCDVGNFTTKNTRRGLLSSATSPFRGQVFY